MADSQLRILIDALWRGRGATGQARADIQGLGASSDSASLQMAALAQRGELLQGKMRELGREVAEGGKTIDQATQEFAEFRDGLAQIDDVAGKGTQSIDTYTVSAAKWGAAIAAAGALAKEAFDLSEAGANLNQLRASFDGLNASVIQTPELLNQMKEASRGTLTEAQLMQGVLKLAAGNSAEMTRALAGASPQLLEIAKAAQKLNPSLGDTAFLYDSITTGIKRASPLILDNLGIVVKVGEANEKYAESIGKTVEQLSAEEKQMALLFGVLEAGDQIVQQVGDNIDSQADSWIRVRTGITEATDAFKSGFAQGLLQADWDSTNEGLERLADNMERLGSLTGNTLHWLNELGKWTPPVILARFIDWVTDPFQEGGAFHQGFVGPVEAAEEAAVELGRGVEYADGALSNYIYTAESAAGATRGLADATEEAIDHHQEYLDALGRATSERLSEPWREYYDALQGAEEAFPEFLSRLSGEVEINANTGPAESQVEDFISDAKKRAIELTVAINDPENRGGNIFDEMEQANWRKEYLEASQALGEQFGDNFNRVLEEKLTGVRPQIAPIVVNAETTEADALAEKLGLTQEEITGINESTITPRVVDVEVKALHELARDAREELSALSEAPHPVTLDTNLAEERAVLGEFYGDWLRLRSKNITLGVTYQVGALPGGSPYGGPYEDPGGPAPGGPAPSLNFQGPAGGGTQTTVGELHIHVNGGGDPTRASDLVIQKLEDRGIVPRVRLR